MKLVLKGEEVSEYFNWQKEYAKLEYKYLDLLEKYNKLNDVETKKDENLIATATEKAIDPIQDDRVKTLEEVFPDKNKKNTNITKKNTISMQGRGDKIRWDQFELDLVELAIRENSTAEELKTLLPERTLNAVLKRIYLCGGKIVDKVIVKDPIQSTYN